MFVIFLCKRTDQGYGQRTMNHDQCTVLCKLYPKWTQTVQPTTTSQATYKLFASDLHADCSQEKMT